MQSVKTESNNNNDDGMDFPIKRLQRRSLMPLLQPRVRVLMRLLYIQVKEQL
jgi:hypothetical protein